MGDPSRKALCRFVEDDKGLCGGLWAGGLSESPNLFFKFLRGFGTCPSGQCPAPVPVVWQSFANF